MPIPSPTNKEKREAFLSRCMGDEVMNSEFPDRKQRFAVCLSKWKAKEKKEKSSDKEE